MRDGRGCKYVDGQGRPTGQDAIPERGTEIAVAGLIVVASTLMGTLPSEADGRRHHGHHHHRGGHVHTRFFVGFGPSYYWGSPYWYYPPAPYVVYSPPPVVVQRSEPVYIQQPTPLAPAPEVSFWYYCQSAGAYYPTVASCPEEWVKVPPR
jgi:hypothetical protein